MKKIKLFFTLILLLTLVISCTPSQSQKQQPPEQKQETKIPSIVGKWEFIAVGKSFPYDEKYGETEFWIILNFDYGSIIEFYKDGTYTNWYISLGSIQQSSGKYSLMDNKTIRFEVSMLGSSKFYTFEYELKKDLLILKDTYNKVAIGLIPYKELPLTYENIDGVWERRICTSNSNPLTDCVPDSIYIEFNSRDKKCHRESSSGKVIYEASFEILNNNQISIIGIGGFSEFWKKYIGKKYILNAKLTKGSLWLDDALYLKKYVLTDY